MPGSGDSPAFIALVQASAGAAGGVFAAFSLMPIEVAKTRIQLSRGGNLSTAGTLAKVVEEEGVPGLFRGSFAKCFETGSKNFVYFYIYDAINAIAKQNMKLTTGVKLVLGYVAGIGTTVSTMPLEVLATKVQAEKCDGGLPVLVQRVLDREGISGLFRGFWYNILLCINPAIQNTCFDKMKDVILARAGPKAALTPLQAFLLGAVAKAIATVVTYPLVRLKTIIQAGQTPAKDGNVSLPRVPTQELSRQASTSQLIQNLSFRSDKAELQQLQVLRRGIELYRGLGSALMKSVLQAALLYMTKDQVASVVRALFRLTAKAFFRRDGRVKLGAFSGRPLAS